MAHTRKKEIRKLKRKFTIQSKIEKVKEKKQSIRANSKVDTLNQINQYINKLMDEMENKINGFKKAVKRLEANIAKLQQQEQKTSERLLGAEQGAVSTHFPAAKKRLKLIQLAVTKIKKQNLTLQRELFQVENSLSNFMGELERLKGLKKVIIRFSREFSLPNLKQPEVALMKDEAAENILQPEVI